MVPDLTQAVDGMNKRRTLVVIFNEVSASIKLRRVGNSSTLFWGEWKAMTCRYRFKLMGANTRRETSMVSLMEFNDSIRVLSLLYRLSSKRRLHYNRHYLGKTFTPGVTFIRYLLVSVAIVILQSIIMINNCQNFEMSTCIFFCTEHNI